MIGKTLGQYEFLSKLGQGGMGKVYRARDSKLGREVAVKLLPENMASDPVRRERFLNEARALAVLNHPHIVTIYAIEELDGAHFLSMELVKGDTLSDRIPPKGCSPEELLGVAIPLAEALSAAHALGLIHRDLKPSNVMINSDGRVKVLDFGLATFAQAESTGDETVAVQKKPLTAEGSIVGTVPYMSPEQIEAKDIDARSDIFSFGVIMYEMATGIRPFSGDSNPGVMSAILRDQPVPASRINPAITGPVGRIIFRCLEKDPRRRFQTAKDLHKELSGLQEGAQRRPEPTLTATMPAVDRPAASDALRTGRLRRPGRRQFGVVE